MSYPKGLKSRTLRAEFDFLYLITQEWGSLSGSVFTGPGKAGGEGGKCGEPEQGSGQHGRMGYGREGGRGKGVRVNGTADSGVNR